MVYGLDIETYDPCLRTRGVSWIFNEGYILCIALYDFSNDKVESFLGAPEKVKEILLYPNATIVGANIGYDIGWLEHHFGIEGQTKASLVDILIAEAMLDEYGQFSLDKLAKKYLGEGKKKTALEAWAEEQGLKGDFRQHLKDAPTDLLLDYVESDAKQPVQIWAKQLPLIKEQDLEAPLKIDFRLITICLQMTRNGMFIDDDKRHKLDETLAETREKLSKDLLKYSTNLNVKSGKQVGELFDKLNIPYKVKVSSKTNFIDTGIDCKFDKTSKKYATFVWRKQLEEVKSILDKSDIEYTANPHIDGKYLDQLVEQGVEIAELIRNAKHIDSIRSKITGEKFSRFIVDGKIHPSFNIAKSDDKGTVSGRFSSTMPNAQQIPAKGKIYDLDLGEACRSLFYAPKGYDILHIDYSQVEYRLFVHYAFGEGAEEARKKFQANPNTDYHQFVMDLTGLERKYAKNCNFGILYGMGVKSMSENFGWPLEHAQEIMNTYHEAVPFVRSTMDLVESTVSKRGYIKTIGGRRARLRYPMVDKYGNPLSEYSREYKEMKTKNKVYTFLNRLNQGGSADIMKQVMVRSYDEGLWDRLIFFVTIHDELGCYVPQTKDGMEAVLQLQHIMEHTIELKVPLVAEPELSGEDWYHMKPFEERRKELGL